MSSWLIWTIFTSAFLLMVIAQIAVRSKKPIKKTITSMVTGLISLVAVNIAGAFTGVTIPVSLLSLGISAIAGIPGVTTILILNMIL